MMRGSACAIGLAAMVVGSAAARADDDAPDETGEPRQHEVDPRDASGIDRPEKTPATTTLLWIPRALLFVPRWTLEVADAPIRLAAYSYDRYGIAHRLGDLFGPAGNFEAVPIIHFESGFGISLGAKLAHKNLFGHGERLRVKAGKGGEFRQFYGLVLDTGDLLGDVELAADLDIDFRGNARFAGVGNSDLTDALPPILADARDRELAVSTRYAQDTYRAELNAVYGISELLTTKLSTAYITRAFGETSDDDDDDIALAYDLDTLTGFRSGVHQVYSELELVLDNRSNAHEVSVAVPNAGWKLSGFGGYAMGVGDDPSSYARFGLDLQRYFGLWRPDRILAVRVYSEMVTADLDQIAFTDLPSLGGSRELRGFFSSRFRDRAIGFVAAEYHYPVNMWTTSFLFAEVGRAFESVADVTWADPRVGFGIGLQIHSRDRFLFRGHVASSSEGGILVNLSVNPIFRQKARTRRQ